MKTLVALAMVVAMSLIAIASAGAQEIDSCSHDSTVQALRECVQHVGAHGTVDNWGIMQSLEVKLIATESAIDRGQPAVALNQLRAFVNQLVSQSGKQLDVHQAEHLRLHANMVILTLSN